MARAWIGLLIIDTALVILMVAKALRMRKEGLLLILLRDGV